MKSNLSVLPALLLSLGTLLPIDDVRAQDGVGQAQPIQMQAQVRAGIHDDYERLVFDWPQQISYSFLQNGQEVSLHFAQSAPVDLSQVTKRHLSKIIRSEQIADGASRTVKLLLAPNTVAKHVQQGGLVILDFYEGDAPVVTSSNLPQAMLIASEAPAHEEAAPSSSEVKVEPKAENQEAKTDAEPVPSNGPVAPNLDDVGNDAVPLVAIDPGIVAGGCHLSPRGLHLCRVR